MKNRYFCAMIFTLITGASSGIGYCYAEQFAQKGNNIIVVSNPTRKLMSGKGKRRKLLWGELASFTP